MKQDKEIPKKLPELHATNWLNGNPSLKDKTILIDFWTYSCVNCIRSLPHIKSIWEKYGEREDFILIGIHTPEFDFEKDIKNVKDAVKRHGIKYPIAMDSEYEIWKSFNNHYWPRQYLFDKNGNYVYNNIGEGNYLELENRLRKLLGLDALKEKEKKEIQGKVTNETYCGKLRGPDIPGRHCKEGQCDNYKDPGERNEGQIYLEGLWDRKEDYLEHKGEEGEIAINYKASNVNVVITSDNYLEIDVYLDDNYIPKEKSGDSVHFDGERSYIVIERDDMYNIINDKEKHQHSLKFEVNNRNVRFYAFTFG